MLIVLNGRNGVTCAVKSGVRCCEKGWKEQRKRVGCAVYFVPIRPPSYIRAAAPISWSARPYMCERPSQTDFLFYQSRAAIIENDYLRSFYGCFSRVPAFVGIRVKWNSKTNRLFVEKKKNVAKCRKKCLKVLSVWKKDVPLHSQFRGMAFNAAWIGGRISWISNTKLERWRNW